MGKFSGEGKSANWKRESGKEGKEKRGELKRQSRGKGERKMDLGQRLESTEIY